MSNEATETIKDLMPQSPDLNAERLAKLKELFPDLFTDEGNLNEVELKKLVDPKSVNETERYEFRWFGKSEAKRKGHTPTTTTLNYDAARSVNPETSENLIIEGENLKVLKLLLCSYREQIKCIYIDPPYNTGKDFVYSDNYSEDRLPYWKQTNVVDEYGVKIDTNADTDGRYHSNWMNMMFSRLLVARQLLRKDGVIFISIDDNEVHNLRRLCNEVFGEDNFIEQFIWRSRLGKGATSLQTARLHEYILCYAKSAEFLEFLPDSRVSEEDSRERLRQWGQGDKREDRPTMYYGIKSKEFGIVYPIKPDGTDGRWRVGKETMKDLQANNLVVFEKQDDDRIEAYKLIPKGSMTETAQNSILGNEIKTTAQGSKELAAIFNQRVFDYAKPTSLVKHFFNVANDKDGIYLDFFSGSGVSGQAVMELNEADGGNRNFILVQLPEFTDEKSEAYKAGYKRISDITIERNKRVVNRIIEEKRAAHPNLPEMENGNESFKGLGFKVFRLEESYFPRTEWNPKPEKTEAENVESLKKYIADKEAQLYIDFDRDKLLTEILLKDGFKLNHAVKPFEPINSNEVLHVSDADKEALVCLDNTIATETVEYFKTNKDLKFICLERGLDTTKKWNLANSLGEKFKAI